jgi:hypothetical protein
MKNILLTLACFTAIASPKIVSTKHRLPPTCKENDYGTKFGVKENHTIRASVRMQVYNGYNWMKDKRPHEPGETVKV